MVYITSVCLGRLQAERADLETKLQTMYHSVQASNAQVQLMKVKKDLAIKTAIEDMDRVEKAYMQENARNTETFKKEKRHWQEEYSMMEVAFEEAIDEIHQAAKENCREMIQEGSNMAKELQESERDAKFWQKEAERHALRFDVGLGAVRRENEALKEECAMMKGRCSLLGRQLEAADRDAKFWQVEAQRHAMRANAFEVDLDVAKAENERLKEENERLKEENERLSAEEMVDWDYLAGTPEGSEIELEDCGEGCGDGRCVSRLGGGGGEMSAEEEMEPLEEFEDGLVESETSEDEWEDEEDEDQDDEDEEEEQDEDEEEEEDEYEAPDEFITRSEWGCDDGFRELLRKHGRGEEETVLFFQGTLFECQAWDAERTMRDAILNGDVEW